jgi:hypothetical protein
MSTNAERRGLSDGEHQEGKAEAFLLKAHLQTVLSSRLTPNAIHDRFEPFSPQGFKSTA